VPKNPDEITVVKLDAHGQEVIRYPARLVADDGSEILLHARWGRPRYDLGYVVLEPDDRWTERFYRDRWYNIFEIHDAEGRLKGWYCNVCRPATLANGELRCVDLVLDLFVRPDGRPLRLDEEEFEELNLQERDPHTYQAARAALEELERMAKQGKPPFRQAVEKRAGAARASNLSREGGHRHATTAPQPRNGEP